MSNSFNSLKVIDKINETADSCSFLLQIPEDLQDTYLYKAGQYLTVKLVINGKEIRRAYSIFTAPNENAFGFTVKRVMDGRASNFLIDSIDIGQSIEVMKPEGKFVLVPEVSMSRDHFFIAGGSGITPIMSMIMTLLEEEPLSTVYLLYANRNESDIIFKNTIDALSEKYKDQFIVSFILSQPEKSKEGGLKGLFSKSKSSWKGLKGRIDAKCLTRFLDDNPSKSNNNYYYLCGPGGLIDTTESYLKSINVDSAKIKREFFTNASEVKNGTSNANASGDSVAQILLNGEKFELTIPKDKTVLEALLDEGKDAPYSCTSGACSTCVAKLIDGSVKMDACFALDEEEVKSGFILTCQSRATTPTLDINYDA